MKKTVKTKTKDDTLIPFLEKGAELLALSKKGGIEFDQNIEKVTKEYKALHSQTLKQADEKETEMATTFTASYGQKRTSKVVEPAKEALFENKPNKKKEPKI